jgi:hypothetical protein
VGRRWLIAAILVGVAAIVIAAVAMRLSDDGSSSQPSAAEWADSVCSSFATWKSSIESLTKVSGGTLTVDTLNQKIADGQAATQTLVDDLRALGPPDLQSGDQAKQQLTTDLAQIQAEFDTLKQGAEEATSAGSPTAFFQALGKLAPQLQTLLDSVSKTISDVQNADVAAQDKAELQAGFADAQSCQELQSSG